MDTTASTSYLKAHVGSGEAPPLSQQELEFVSAYVVSKSHTAAAKRAGITPTRAKAWLEREDIQCHIEILRDRQYEHFEEKISYDIRDAHIDIEMGKRMAANASEWFKGVELQMKLHGLLDKKQEVNININQINSRKQLEELEDTQIMELAGFSFDDLLPQAIEGEIVDGEE